MKHEFEASANAFERVVCPEEVVSFPEIDEYTCKVSMSTLLIS